MRRSFRLLGLTTALSSVAATSAQAQSSDTSNYLAVSARSWYLFDAVTHASEDGVIDTLEFPVLSETTASSTPIAMPMGGMSLAWSPPSMNRTVFTGTIGYGEGRSRRVVRRNAVGFLRDVDPATATASDIYFVGSTVVKSTIAVKRADVELSVQHQFNDTFGLMAGLRTEWIEAEHNAYFIQIANVRYTGTPLVGIPAYEFRCWTDNPQPGVIPACIERNPPDTTTLYSGRVGLTGSLPVTSDFRHTMSATGMLFLGYRNVDAYTAPSGEAWLFGPDISVGYSYLVSDRVSVDARYRALVFFSDTGYEVLAVPRTTHGLNLSLTYRFN